MSRVTDSRFGSGIAADGLVIVGERAASAHCWVGLSRLAGAALFWFGQLAADLERSLARPEPSPELSGVGVGSAGLEWPV